MSNTITMFKKKKRTHANNRPPINLKAQKILFFFPKCKQKDISQDPGLKSSVL